jgi:hypothetical protein
MEQAGLIVVSKALARWNSCADYPIGRCRRETAEERGKHGEGFSCRILEGCSDDRKLWRSAKWTGTPEAAKVNHILTRVKSILTKGSTSSVLGESSLECRNLPVRSPDRWCA